jgi:hypothetical protein
LFDVLREGSTRGMLGCDSVLVVGTMTKFSVNGAEDLLRGWWALWKREAIGVIVFVLVEYSILGIRGNRRRKGERWGGSWVSVAACIAP